MREAMLYSKLPENRVRCELCAHRCVIKDGRKGICRVRENSGGVLYTVVYGRTISQNVDPIEKKPLYHVYPATFSYSIATPGCNFRCTWCQNAEISQMVRDQNRIAGHPATPEQIVRGAMATNCKSIAYTYTEPTIFFEYAYDTSRLAHENGLVNLFISNGYMTPEMLDMYSPYLDAANIDLKGFRKEVYRKYAGARLEPVLDSLKKIKSLGIWLEVTTLVIPGINDDEEQLRDAAQFVAKELGRETPWHISRFFPAYHMQDVPPTPVESLKRAYDIGLEEGLYYVYLGNVAETYGAATFCPGCGAELIVRTGYHTDVKGLSNGACRKCGRKVDGLGMEAAV
jgi:pyruvate formate lyase activating enzyme